MLRIVSISLAFVLLVSSLVDLHDLSALPYMIEHYQEHKNKADGFSFVEFMDLHYGGKAEQHDKEEHEQHEGLPFKSHHCSTMHHSSIILQHLKPSLITSVSCIVEYSNFYQSSFTIGVSESIWQPPRKS